MSKHELIKLSRIVQFSNGGFYFVKSFNDKSVKFAKLEDVDQLDPRTIEITHDTLKHSRPPFKCVGYACRSCEG